MRDCSISRLLVLLMAAAGGACGSGKGGGNTGGTGGGGPVTLDGPCALDARVGGFAVAMHPATAQDPGYTSVDGSVRAGVLPAGQQEGDAAGGCRLMAEPGNVTQPSALDVGQVTVSGVGASALTLTQVSPSAPTYSGSVTSPYPPFAPAAAVHLRAAGAAVPAFSLDGEGFEPLAFDGTGLTVTDGQAFSFSWTAPATAAPTRIFAVLEIGHHGGVMAHVECDLPDTGSAEVSAAIVSALVAKGVHGFPTLTLSRQTADSTTVGPGCVDFIVASPVDHVVAVCTAAGSCVTSCGPDLPCPSGMTCQADSTCS